MDGQFDEKFGFRCCFCNQKIIENTTDPVMINVSLNEDIINKMGTNQTFWSHFNCFKEKLHQYFKGYFIKESDFRLYDDENLIVKNKDCLIKKIIELETIEQWKVIYYGLDRKFIDTRFVIDYCYALIEREHSVDQFVLDIAGLTTKDDLNNIPKMIAEKIGNSAEILIDKEQYYSKIWSYLSLAAEMCAEKIIKY